MYFGCVFGPQVCVYYRCFNLQVRKHLAPVLLSEFVSVYDEDYPSKPIQMVSSILLNSQILS